MLLKSKSIVTADFCCSCFYLCQELIRLLNPAHESNPGENLAMSLNRNVVTKHGLIVVQVLLKYLKPLIICTVILYSATSEFRTQRVRLL